MVGLPAAPAWLAVRGGLADSPAPPSAAPVRQDPRLRATTYLLVSNASMWYARSAPAFGLRRIHRLRASAAHHGRPRIHAAAQHRCRS